MRYHIDDVIKDVRVCVEENATTDALESFDDVETLVFGELVRSKVADGVAMTEDVAPLWKLEGHNIPLDRDAWVRVSEEGDVFGRPLAVPIDTTQVYMTDADDTTYDGGITVNTKAMDDVDAVIIGRDGSDTLMSVSAAGINWIGDDAKRGGWVYLPSDFMRLLVFEMSDWDMPVFDAIDESSPYYGQQRSAFCGVRGNAERPVVAIVPKTGGKALEFYACKSKEAKVVTASYLPLPKIIGNMIEISKACYRASIYNIASLVAMSRGESDFAKQLQMVAQNLL